MARLRFGYNTAFGEEKKTRYKAALKRFVDKWGDHEISAMASFHWASVLQEESELVEARQVAQRAANAFPNSTGGKLSFNLVAQIEAKASTSPPSVWNQPLPTVQVRYRNVTKVFIPVVPYSFEERLKPRPYRPEQLDQAERNALLAKPPVKEWAADLPAIDDFQERAEGSEGISMRRTKRCPSSMSKISIPATGASLLRRIRHGQVEVTLLRGMPDTHRKQHNEDP